MIRRPPRSTLFPSRRSSDLHLEFRIDDDHANREQEDRADLREGAQITARRQQQPHRHQDRKSTRLNSSHSQISYAVFCLKKKKQTKNSSTPPKYITTYETVR